MGNILRVIKGLDKIRYEGVTKDNFPGYRTARSSLTKFCTNMRSR